MRKFIYGGVILVLILSLSYNVFWLLSDKNEKDNCFTLNGELLTNIENIETEDEITDFNYEIQENDEVRIYIYEYKKDGINHIFSSKRQLENTTEELKSSIEDIFTKVNGKNATSGLLYGPVYTVKIEIESATYDMEIMLGEGFMTIDITEDGIHKVFTIRNELNTEINQLITDIKNED